MRRHRTGVRLHSAAEDFDQRGLAGAVFTDECMYFAGPDVEVHCVEHADAAVALRQLRGDQHDRAFDMKDMKSAPLDQDRRRFARAERPRGQRPQGSDERVGIDKRIAEFLVRLSVRTRSSEPAKRR